jgi:hypothetical protein
MQRVRIGLTGLAFVFVLVLMAAIFINPSDEEPITANTIEQQLGPDGNAAANIVVEEPAPKEPLAELGVAPGNIESNSAAEEPEVPSLIGE